MYSKLFASLIVLASFSAHAADSEFFYQSKAGQSDLTPRLGYVSAAVKGKGAGAVETKFSGIYQSGVSYEYGINEMFSVEGTLLYSSYETDSTPKTKTSGLQDPQVVLKGTSDMGNANLRFGLRAGLSLEKAEDKANGDSNTASGGFSFAPYVGVDTEAAGGSVGGRLFYTFMMERTREEEGGPDVKTKDGNVLGLSAFYETAITDVILGGSLNYASYDTAKLTSEGMTGEIKSFNTTGLSLYSRMPFGSWALLPRLDYDFSHSEASKFDIINLSVAARFGF
ncbi:porin family protein [Bdellovibrio bacteriovorus]|uniref:porin family protein n=1 Tax=Bdellovibrio bacteriovorus TaxID=959 RepID=UPI0021CF87D1|nr:porin family protein [Bdellovibrio bacteriovorus]UXR64809.1 porin family protein [Bdellovibrio bacteriovorus]